MKERRELDLQQEIEEMRARHAATNKVIEALMICLPYAQQRFVLQHLQSEAKDLQQSFGTSAEPDVREWVEHQAQAMQKMALRLERVHLATMQTQWAEAASPESAALKDLSPLTNPVSAAG